MNDLGIYGDVKTTKRWKVINVDRQWDLGFCAEGTLWSLPSSRRVSSQICKTGRAQSSQDATPCEFPATARTLWICSN